MDDKRSIPTLMSCRTAVRDTVWPSKEPGKKPYFIPGGTPSVLVVYPILRRSVDFELFPQRHILPILDAPPNRLMGS